jgi:hypothetical protein
MKPTENQILIYIGNSSAGWADCLDVPQGQSVEMLCHETMPGQQLEGYRIQVNCQPARPDTVLRDGDRVTITPLKMQQAQPRPASIAGVAPRSNLLQEQC